MANLVLTKNGIYVDGVCVAKYPTAGLGSRFVSAVQQIPVPWKHLAKVWCLIVLAGSTYLGYKIYWHFCNRTSLNQHLQGSEWIELNKEAIIEVIEEPRLENNLPHNDASRKEHPRIMKIARILVRTSMSGSQLNEDTSQINLQTENSSLVLPVPMGVDPSDVSGNNDTVQTTTSEAIGTLEVPVAVDPSDISVCNVALQPTTSASISILESPVPVTEPSDISVRNDAVQSKTSASILKEIGERVGFLNIFETGGEGYSTEVEQQEFCKAVNSLHIISRFLSQTYYDEELNTNYIVNGVKLMDIRHDIFSMLRAVLLQNVMCRVSLLQRIGGAKSLAQKFETWYKNNQDWLMYWRFNAINRFGMSSFHEIFYSCLDALQSLIDFSLLGYSLRETVAIVRPYLHGTQDYVKRYPECMLGIWPEVVVFANKEGQYSIRGN